MTRADVDARLQAVGEYDLASNWIALGKLLRQRNGAQTIGRQTVTAIDCFAKALDLDPGNTEAANCLDLCLQDGAMLISSTAPPAARPSVAAAKR